MSIRIFSFIFKGYYSGELLLTAPVKRHIGRTEKRYHLTYNPTRRVAGKVGVS